MTKEEIEAGYNEITRVWLEAIMSLMIIQEVKELTFFNKSVKTPNGGLYLLQFQHVDGPKIQLAEEIG